MWYELLPFFGLMTGCVVLSDYVTIPFSYFRTGKKRDNRNAVSHYQDWRIVNRDHLITGSFYKTLGLEAIPDEK